MQLLRLRMCLTLARVSPGELSIASAAMPLVLTVLFSSDGLAELFDPQGRQFGYEAVADSFRIAAQADGAHGVIEHLLAAAAAFRETRPLDDDITLVAIRITGR